MNLYWNKKGKYQTEYNTLFEKLVPVKGSSKTTNGELLRIASKLYYEFYNNGNCNSVEVLTENTQVECFECYGKGEINGELCDECCGEGVLHDEIETGVEILYSYKNDLQYIKAHIGCDDLISDIEKIMCDIQTTQNDEYYLTYESLINTVIEFITKNK
jgi:hypothetical protein